MAWEHHSFTRPLEKKFRSSDLDVDHEKIVEELNALGSSGWQLVSVVAMFTDGVVHGMVYFLKREADKRGARFLK